MALKFFALSANIYLWLNGFWHWVYGNNKSWSKHHPWQIPLMCGCHADTEQLIANFGRWRARKSCTNERHFLSIRQIFSTESNFLRGTLSKAFLKIQRLTSTFFPAFTACIHSIAFSTADASLTYQVKVYWLSLRMILPSSCCNILHLITFCIILQQIDVRLTGLLMNSRNFCRSAIPG